MKKSNLRLMGLLCPRIKHRIQHTVVFYQWFLMPITVLFVSCQALAQEVKVQQMPSAATVSINDFKETSTLLKSDGDSPKTEQDTTFQEKITPLKIGDKIPDELWEMYFPVVSTASEKEQYLSLGDFKDKLIILDFWATWCAPCISSLHKLDSLQKEFEGDLVVVPTSYEPKEKVQPFFANKGWSLPTAYEETYFYNFFPHQSVPHQVWIKEGKVIAIASPRDLNRESIRNTLAGKELSLPLKWENAEYDARKPLFIKGNGGDGDELLYQSIFSTYVEGLNSGAKDIGPNYITITNNTAMALFAYAYKQTIPSFSMVPNRSIMNVSDSLKRVLIGRDFENRASETKWNQKNSFCYNLLLPGEISIPEKLLKMQRDLNDFFSIRYGMVAKIEKREVKALVLKNARHGVRVVNNVPQNSTNKFYYQFSFVNRKSSLPIVLEENTHIPEKMIIKADFKDIKAVQQELQQYGLVLEEEIRPLDMLVFSTLN